MKKKINIILSMIMIFAMVILAGCSGSKEEQIIGSWETTIDATEIMKQAVSDKEMSEYIDFGECSLKMVYTFNEDGTYKAAPDEAATKEIFSNIKETYIAGITKYFEDQIAESSLSISVDELMAESGTSIDELAEKALGDEAVKKIIDSSTVEGKYEVKDGKLYTTESMDEDIDENKYETYEMSKDELKILESIGDDNGENGIDYPIIFNRI